MQIEREAEVAEVKDIEEDHFLELKPVATGYLPQASKPHPSFDVIRFIGNLFLIPASFGNKFPKHQNTENTSQKIHARWKTGGPEDE